MQALTPIPEMPELRAMLELVRKGNHAHDQRLLMGLLYHGALKMGLSVGEALTRATDPELLSVPVRFNVVEV